MLAVLRDGCLQWPWLRRIVCRYTPLMIAGSAVIGVRPGAFYPMGRRGKRWRLAFRAWKGHHREYLRNGLSSRSAAISVGSYPIVRRADESLGYSPEA